jgi:hypothetical protein
MPPPRINSDTLTSTERRFLVQAWDTERALKPIASRDNLIPLLKWRTIGAMLLTGGAELARQAYEATATRARRIRGALLALVIALLIILFKR